MRECTKCHEVKPVGAFGLQSRSPDGRSRQCLVCRQAVRRASEMRRPPGPRPPRRKPPQLDRVHIRQALRGERVRLTMTERLVVVRIAADRGMEVAAAGRLLGISARAIYRLRKNPKADDAWQMWLEECEMFGYEAA